MKPFLRSPEEKEGLIDLIATALSGREAVLFAYVYGSFSCGPFRDIDIAVFFRDAGKASNLFSLEHSIEQELHTLTGLPVDVIALNASPLTFAYTVISTGRVILSKDEHARSDFECRVITEYHDFSFYRKRYRREALGLV
jgi:hypothetical protein